MIGTLVPDLITKAAQDVVFTEAILFRRGAWCGGRGVSTAASSNLYLCAGSNAVRVLRICKVQVVAVTESTEKATFLV